LPLAPNTAPHQFAAGMRSVDDPFAQDRVAVLPTHFASHAIAVFPSSAAVNYTTDGTVFKGAFSVGGLAPAVTGVWAVIGDEAHAEERHPLSRTR